MAQTYTALASGVTLPTTLAAKTLLKMYNTHATLKNYVTRVWCLNTAIAAVTGVYQTLSLGRFTTDQATGTAVVPIKHDTSGVLAPTWTCASATTVSVTLVDTFMQYVRTGDEFATGTAKLDNLFSLPAFGLIFDSGYGDTNVEPIVLNTNEGLALTATGVATGVGTVDVIFEFYVA
jgi:hypothetical protein